MNKEDFNGFFDFAIMVAAEIQKRDQQIQELVKKDQESRIGNKAA